MRKTIILLLLVYLAGCLGCSSESLIGSRGIPVVFDGTPQIFDPSVHYQGAAVGRVVSRDWNNGVTRVVVDLDSSLEDLKKTNLVFVVSRGRLHAATLGGYGEALPADACINGFVNTASYRWFKLTHLMDNINLSADRRARTLLARSGLSG